MDRYRKIAYSFFEMNEKYFLQIFNNQVKYGKFSIRYRFISSFECLFGIVDTLPYFLDWVVNNKKINIPENTTFIYRDTDRVNQQGLSWTEILSTPGVKKSIRWVYSDGKVVETDFRTDECHGMNLERARQVKMRNI